MNRRRVLAAVSTSLPASGCLGRLRPPGADQPDPDSETTTPSGESSFKMLTVIHDATSTEQPVSVTLTNDGATVLEREVTAVPNGESALETGIDQEGQYELGVAVESGPRETFSVGVDEYDLREGSNLPVTIAEDHVEILMQEWPRLVPYASRTTSTRPLLTSSSKPASRSQSAAAPSP